MKDLINDKYRTVIILLKSIDTLSSFCDMVMWLHDRVVKDIGEPTAVLDNYVKFMNQ